MELEDLQAYNSRRSDSPLFARLAERYLEQGDTAGAIELCTAGVENYPSYTTGYVILARSYVANAQPQEALTAIHRARKLFPDSIRLVLIQKDIESKLQPVAENKEEEEEQEPVKQEGKQEGEIASQTLAEIYVKQGLIKDAITAYRQLIERKPDQRAGFEKRIRELEKK